MDKPILSKQAFWDVDMDSIDYDKDALFVMESVINNGSLEDFYSIRKFYGDEKISKTVISTKELGPKEVNFLLPCIPTQTTRFYLSHKKSIRLHNQWIITVLNHSKTFNTYIQNKN